MRISTSMQYNTSMMYIQKANSRLDEAAQQYNTGKKFTTAGQDPSGMSSSIKYTSDVSAYDQYKINAGLAADTLSQSETALEQLWNVLNSLNVSLQQAVNGTMDESSKNAIAATVEQAQSQIFDLMNTKNAEGEYIFAGNQSSQPAFTLTSDGNYICQADGGSRSVQVSPTQTVQVNDSALNIFQNVAKAKELNGDDTAVSYTDGTGATVNATLDDEDIQITSNDDFEDLYADYFTTINDQGENTLTFEIDADGNFTLTDYKRDVVDRGELTESNKIVCKGLTIDVSSIVENSANGSGSVSITLQPVEKDNILNVLSDVISVLRDTDMSNEEYVERMAMAQISVSNAMTNYDKYRGEIGARLTQIDSIIDSDEALGLIKETAMANVTEIDTYEAVSNLLKEQMVLQSAQQSYAIVHSSTLFDYI